LLKQEHKIALLIGAPIAIVGSILLYQKVRTAQLRYLLIATGEGGTTDPAPGRYQFYIGENVTITAIPDEGYTVGQWVVDGITVAEGNESLTITMDSDHSVIVTFWKGGVAPPSPPVAIQSLGSIYVKSNIGAWFTGTPGIDQCCHVSHCDESWNPNGMVKEPIKFKVVDATGRGVPNVDVALWTEPPPDGSRYAGVMLLDGEVHTSVNPLIKKTDETGVVYADVSYGYGLNDKFKTICVDAGVGFQYGTAILPCVSWAYAEDGLCLWPLMYVCWVSGDCETQKAGCERMGSWQINRVYAQVVGTTIGTVEIAYCGFHVKWI